MRGLSPSAGLLRESGRFKDPEWGLKGAGMRTLALVRVTRPGQDLFSHPLLACPRRNCDGNPLTAYGRRDLVRGSRGFIWHLGIINNMQSRSYAGYQVPIALGMPRAEPGNLNPASDKAKKRSGVIVALVQGSASFLFLNSLLLPSTDSA